METDRTAMAAALMTRFAARTGLGSELPPRRYLWTDAFAVCTFLGLSRALCDEGHRARALDLIQQVHRVLGRHRADDPRTGWISGLPDAVAEAHPTRGGLRIGKPLPERAASDPLDSDLEWDRDGQYFHYLTKWMHALDQAARWTGAGHYALWAAELADVAHRAFTRGAADERRMVWKMSIALDRPLVASMGQHDPLDGLVTCAQLQATAAALEVPGAPSLEPARQELRALVDEHDLATTDPLGIGGLLVDACRLAQIGGDAPLVGHLLTAAAFGLRRWVARDEVSRPASRRLAFRELGLSIGLAGVAQLEVGAARARLDASAAEALAGLAPYAPLRGVIERFWMDGTHRSTRAWLEHEDIDDVMLATSLAPEGFLDLGSPAASARRPPRDRAVDSCRGA